MTVNNNLKNIFFMPCWGGKTKEHFSKTILRPVQQSTIFPNVSQPVKNELKAIFGDRDIAVWGSVDGGNNLVFFNKMKPDDYILFAVDQRIKIVGQIALKATSADLSNILWPNAGKRVFSLVYFIKNVTKVNTPLSEIFAALGYSHNYIIRGLTAVSEARLKAFYADKRHLLSMVTGA